MTTADQRITAYMPQCKNFEGTVPWMYLDTYGFVTVGTGHMLPSVTAACAQPFVGEDGTLASDADITAVYLAVKRMERGHTPPFYAQVKPYVRLTADSSDTILRQDLAYFDGALQTRVTCYAAMPLPAQLALLDMAFELGASGLILGYPKLMAACAAGDWAMAAGQCFRKGPSILRNLWTENQFKAAI